MKMATMKTDGPDKQMEFLTKEAARDSPCPKCGDPQSLFEACVEDKLDIGDWSNKNTFKCTCCGTPLKYHLPWPTGAWHWRLDTVHVPEFEDDHPNKSKKDMKPLLDEMAKKITEK
jgi:hypothetical protein